MWNYYVYFFWSIFFHRLFNPGHYQTMKHKTTLRYVGRIDILKTGVIFTLKTGLIWRYICDTVLGAYLRPFLESVSHRWLMNIWEGHTLTLMTKGDRNYCACRECCCISDPWRSRGSPAESRKVIAIPWSGLKVNDQMSTTYEPDNKTAVNLSGCNRRNYVPPDYWDPSVWM